MKQLNDFFKTVTLLLCATLIAYLFNTMAQTATNIAIVYMMFIVIIARITSGYRWGILASIVGVIAVNYFFTEPFMEIDFQKNGYPITFLGMLAISLITGTTTAHLKEQTRMSSERERILDKLNSLNSQLLTMETRQQIEDLILEYVYNLVHSSTIFWRYSSDTGEAPIPLAKATCRQSEEAMLSSQNFACLMECIEQKKMLSVLDNGQDSIFFPLVSHNTVWGVLQVHQMGIPKIIPEMFSFLKLFVNQAAMAMERQTYADRHHALIIETEKEKTRSNLLRSISHDIRTPLTGIIGASQACLEEGILNGQEKKKLLVNIYEDSIWLMNMVDNILSVTRINENGGIVKKTPEALEEIISESVQRFKKRHPKANLKVEADSQICMVPADPMLIEQVIINFLENAVKHSGTETVTLKASIIPGSVLVEVIDQGKGIDENRLPNIFEGYGMLPNNSSDAVKGLGIGLSICKSIITAHKGTVSAKNYDGGAIFSFTVPLEEDK